MLSGIHAIQLTAVDGDVVQVIWAIEQALDELDIAPADGRGVAAVTSSLQGVAAAAR